MNKADRNYSIQPHGLNYDKHFQGSNYEDGEEVDSSIATDTSCTAKKNFSSYDIFTMD